MVMAAQTSSSGSWPDPTPLTESPVPSFPVQVLPDWLAGYVDSVRHDVQAPVDFAGAWMLGALATVAGGLVEVRTPTGQRQGVNLYIAVLAEPGTRKSAVHGAMTLPIFELEMRLTELIADRRREAEADRVLAKKDLRDADTRLKAAVSDADRAQAKKDYVQALQAVEEAVVPFKPELSSGDSTPESVTVGLWQQGGRYAISSSEANVFQQMAGLYGKDPNIDVYLQGYTNDPIQVRRGGFSDQEATTTSTRADIQKPALTINVGGQPAVLQAISRDGMLAKRGGLDRFCWIVPDDVVGTRETWPTRSSDHHRDLYHQKVVELGVQLWQAIDEWHPNGEPVNRPFLVFDGAGAARMKAWLEDKEARLKPSGDLRPIRGWAAKIDSFVCRIAALLHLAGNPSKPLANTVIGEETVAAARAIGDYLIAHARRAMRADGDATQLDHARTIVEWIQRTRKTEFDRREAYTNVNRFRKDADAIDAPLTFLVRRGWLREVEIEGSRVNRGFLVNPLTHHAQDA
jgi:replicative DNA helicase